MSWENREYNRDNGDNIPPVQFRFPPITRLTGILIAVNLGLFLLKIFGRPYDELLRWGALEYGAGTGWQVWRFVTYQYLHASGAHVFFNMLGLYFLLPALERRWGVGQAFAFYTAGGIVSGLTFMVLSAINGNLGFLVGASGSIFAVLGADALLFPEWQIVLVFFLVPIRLAAGLIAGLYLLTIVGDHDYSNAAHLGGLAFGFFAPWLGGPLLVRQQMKLRAWQGDRALQEEIDEQQAVDRILEKVSQSGMQSLTGREKKTLQRASDNQRKRDKERAARYGGR
ncbi:MAG: rhomboid family intramembrane serine protease [Tepidisphaeraceae bacterium]